MCSITKPSSSPQKTQQQGQAISVTLVALSILFGSLWSRGLPLRSLPTAYISTAFAALVGFLACVVWFVNFYIGQKLRKCNPLITHLAGFSKKTAPHEYIVDLDKVANPEGLSQMWKDEVLSKGDSYNILLTGVTGYVGRAFLYQLLREISIGEEATGKKVPHKVYVMARAKARKNLSAAQRLDMLKDEPMFAPYKKHWDEVVVAAQSGDLQDINCGMSDETLQMLGHAKITHVVHCAADVNFNRPLTDSAGINISPALQLQSLAQQWPTCRRFVHCSTAFVNPGNGSPDKPMAEQLFSLGKYNPQDLYDSMRGDKKLALAVKEELAFPNNYVFTKCVAEHLVVRNNKKMELKIVRPAIVGPAWALPEPGWNGEKPSTITALLLLWGTRVIRFAPLVKRAIPMVPVDIVAVSIIHAMITPPAAPKPKSADAPVSIRNLIWSHKSPRDCIDGMKMAEVCIPGAVMKQHFSATETAISYALIDIVYGFPMVFPVLHLIFNLGPLYLLQFVCWAVKTCGIKSVLEQVPVVKLLRFSDMLTLYGPYMGREYYFESSIDVPETMDMNQYCASLFKAVHTFWTTLFPGTIEDLNDMELLPNGRLDLWWALTYPSKNFGNRILAYLGSKILRQTHGSAIVDLYTMEQAATTMLELEETMSEQKHCVVLASSGDQTPLDDVLNKFVAFSMAGLGIDVPHTFGEADMDDPKLGSKLEDIKASFDRHVTLTANFKESAPSESFLKTLVESPGDHDFTVIPLCMEFDRSKASITKSTAETSDLGIWDMLSLYWQVCIQGKHSKEFGSVKVSYGKPSALNAESDSKVTVSYVQREHSRLMSISTTHLAAAEAHLNIPTETLKGAVQTLGVSVNDDANDSSEQQSMSSQSNWNLHKQWIPNFAPYLNESHPDWATAMGGAKLDIQSQATVPPNGEVEQVLKAICTVFDAADVLAIRARTSLHQKNVEKPTMEDLVKEMEAIDSELKDAASSFIFEAAASIALRKTLSSEVPVGSEEKKEF